MSVLHVVLIIGFLGMIPANFLLVNLKDAQHEEEGSEARGEHCRLRHRTLGPRNPVASNLCFMIVWLPHFSVSHKTSANLPPSHPLSLMHRKASGAYCNMRYARVVPWLICTLDVVTAIGAGMTVKFFPLFFKEDYGLNPGYLDLCRNTWNSCPKNMFDVSVQHYALPTDILVHSLGSVVSESWQRCQVGVGFVEKARP